MSSSAQYVFEYSNMCIFSITLPLNHVSVLVLSKDLCLKTKTKIKRFKKWIRMLPRPETLVWISQDGFSSQVIDMWNTNTAGMADCVQWKLNVFQVPTSHLRRKEVSLSVGGYRLHLIQSSCLLWWLLHHNRTRLFNRSTTIHKRCTHRHKHSLIR